MTDEYYMQMAIAEARKSLLHDDVPVGAVIVKDGEIISKAHNTREKDQLTISHAEITAISRANKKVSRHRLDGLTIYVTKEPCLMCMAVILSAKIGRVVYGAKDLRFGTEYLAKENNFNHKCEIEGGILKHECEELLTVFFKKLRGKNESSRKNQSYSQEERKR